MIVKPGNVGFAYTDALRQQFDDENSEVIATNAYPQVVFFGDSLLRYLPLKREAVAWSWANRGIPGDVTPYMSVRFEADVLQLRPKQVVLLAGVNDIINVLEQKPPYVSVSVEAAVSAVCEHLSEMAWRARAQGIEVLIGSILPIETPMGKQIDNAVAKAAIGQVNMCLQDVCMVNGYQYVDFYTPFVDLDTGYMNRALSVDGIHLKKKGYNIFLDILRQFLG